MIYERKDRGCKAKILHITDDSILLTAFWPSAKGDDRNKISNGITRNTLNVSRSYFERKYGQINEPA